MANGLGKLMNFLKLTDEDDEFDDDFYDDYDDDYDQKALEREEKRLAKEKRREEKRSTPSYRESSYRGEEDFSYERETATPPRRSSVSSFRPSSSGKVVQMPSSGGGDMEVCIVKPKNIGESQQVCTLLMEQHPVVVNLEGIDMSEAQRIMDFIAGCIYAINGNMCQVSRYIFIFSPKDIDISGDYIKSLENDESYNIASIGRDF